MQRFVFRRLEFRAFGENWKEKKGEKKEKRGSVLEDGICEWSNAMYAPFLALRFEQFEKTEK